MHTRQKARDGGALAPEEDESSDWAAYRRGVEDARKRLFSRYQPVAHRIAWRFRRDEPSHAVDHAELRQFAIVGLLEAMERYDPTRGIPFRYFCTRRITGAIIDGIGRAREVNAQIVARRQIERERLRSIRDKVPLPETLEEKLALIGDVAAELAIGLMLEDSAMILTEDRDPSPDAYETLAWKQAAQRLAATLEHLPPRERSVIHHHYVDGMPFEQVARLLGLSKGRISQLHKAGLGLLRKRLSDLGQFHLRS